MGAENSKQTVVRVFGAAISVAFFGMLHIPSATADDMVARGEYLTAAGGCYGCHTIPGDGNKPYAGGRALKTPFGVFYSPNITPDGETGIGGWTDTQFLTALKTGISPSGHPYFPVFPYTSYTKITDEDGLAIKAYLDSLPKVVQEDKGHEVSAPFSWRWLQWGWRLLFFNEGPYVAPEGASTEVARGGYLVDALTHCGECHTPRNMFGGVDASLYLAGTPNGGEGEFVPNITPDNATGIGEWSKGDIVSFMKTGLKPDYDDVQGSMEEVIEHSLSKLTEEDLTAIADYLKSIKPIKNVVKRASAS
ncbi:MAG: cytochrome c [Sneathiella sp.]|uniref:c-type cytochrome n=1 Tax=Sneathiella sp. TaxID=1964365 RepID=UPI003001199F